MKNLLSFLRVLCLLAGAVFCVAEQEEADSIVFVYLCGSDLETEEGVATDDLLEMIDAGTDDNVRFVVQTGGAKAWMAQEAIPADRTGRFEIHSGDLFPLYEGELENMGEAATLRLFLSGGLGRYRAEHFGLILWNHGSGSINGVCFDELFDMDSLTLKEICEALQGFEDTFEFISVDACLMASVEAAQMVAPFSRYMIASEELEPGSGWDYKALGGYLKAYPQADGEEIGRVIADRFLAANTLSEEEALATLSVTALHRLPALTEALDEVGWEMLEAVSDPCTPWRHRKGYPPG